MEVYTKFYGLKDSIAKLSDLPKLSINLLRPQSKSQQIYIHIYNLAN